MENQREATIGEFIQDPINNSDVCFNFYDWFCKDSSLPGKAKSFVPKLKFLVKEKVLNPDTLHAWFKNNCPCWGNLYDDIRINRISDGEFLGGFCPRTGHEVDMKASVWLLGNDHSEDTLPSTIPHTLTTEDFKEYSFPSWTDLKKAIKTCPEFKAELSKHFSN